MKRNVGSLALFIALLMTIVWVTGEIIPAVNDPGKRAEAATSDSGNDTESDETDVIIINNDDYKKDRKGPVKLTHTKHAKDYNVSCWDCHHEYDEKINLWTPLGETLACNDCHDPIEVQDEAERLQTAYHQNCKGCHRELAQQNQTTGPHRKCLKCHEKKTD